MDPAVAALDIAKAGVILANMIESYLAGGAPPSNPEGAEHDDLQDRRSTSVAGSVHLHSSIDDGAGPLQSGEHRAPVQSGEQGTVDSSFFILLTSLFSSLHYWGRSNPLH